MHIDIVTEITIVSFRSLSVGFPANKIFDFLSHAVLYLILDHGVSYAKVPIS